MGPGLTHMAPFGTWRDKMRHHGQFPAQPSGLWVFVVPNASRSQKRRGCRVDVPTVGQDHGSRVTLPPVDPWGGMPPSCPNVRGPAPHRQIRGPGLWLHRWEVGAGTRSTQTCLKPPTSPFPPISMQVTCPGRPALAQAWHPSCFHPTSDPGPHPPASSGCRGNLLTRSACEVGAQAGPRLPDHPQRAK